ncbi:MAG: hypothetical protein JRN58_05690 [Nitrososphaerota archaeon]|nr:hypothetical protein [Nitrososphaerota archaeon]MDG6978555.1 hypothetical protein [Nitrososphaerota archaeon]
MGPSNADLKPAPALSAQPFTAAAPGAAKELSRPTLFRRLEQRPRSSSLRSSRG